MADRPVTREKAIAWCVGLFVVSIFGPLLLMLWKDYPRERMWLGVLLYMAVFGCAFVLGSRADREALRESLGAGLRTLVQPAPVWALAVVVLELLVFLILGLSWLWRSVAPLGLGIFAGYMWARQQPAAGEPGKADKGKPPDVDLWKP